MLGIGIDAVDVDRFRAVLTRTPAVERRLFTDDERASVAGADPVPRLAARFAAKEATMKSLGVGIGAFSWHDVAVARAEGGAPSLVVTGGAADLARARGVTGWLVSLTHTHVVAQAVVVAL